MELKPGQAIYVAPCGHGPFGKTRVRSDINRLTGKPFEPIVTIGYPATLTPTTLVNTEMGPIQISRVMPCAR